MKFIFLILFSFILVQGCTSLKELDRVAKVNEIETEVSPKGKVLNEGRNLVIKGKQSLKIALLKMRFLVPGVDYNYKKKNSVLIDRNILLTLKNSTEAAKPSTDLYEFEGIQKQLMPELYQLFSLIEELDLHLILLCSSLESCRGDNIDYLIPKSLKTVKVVKNSSLLKRYPPILILSEGRGVLTKLNDLMPHNDQTYWSSRMIELPQLSSINLTYGEWASLVPTVNEF